MNCQDFEELALVLARNSLLDAATREQGLIHMEACERCASRLAEERALLARVRAIVDEMAGEEPPARVETALLAAFRAQSAIVSAPRRARHWSNLKLAAVAAGILLLISVMAVILRSAGSQRPQRQERAVAPDASPASPKQAKPPAVGDRLAIEQSVKEPKRTHRRTTVNNSDEVEVVTEFFPLREGEDLNALESLLREGEGVSTLDNLQVVRIELPGAALSDVGLPVDPETVIEPVKADVVLGQDGLARAIRFVR
jgi:hypothetical protein